MAEEDNDKSEPASPFKLKEARNKGQVAKSLELNSLLVILGFLFVIYLWGDNFIYQDLAVKSYIFEQSHVLNYEPARLVNWMGSIFGELFYVFLPLIAFLLLIAVISNLIQTGFIFSLFPIKPDFKRISPMAGLKRLFSTKLLFEAFKSIVKLVIFSAILYFALSSLLPNLVGLMQMNPDYYPTQVLSMIVEVIMKILFGLIIIALLDVLYTKWDFAKKMKMSPREVKEEVKRREGDPLLRAKIKELQREAAKRRESLNRVPDADVLITNPTHISVALKYKRNDMKAPVLLAKGAGDLALRMKKMAKKHDVPIVENKQLARKLFRELSIDDAIRADHFGNIAEVYANLYEATEMSLTRKQAPGRKG